jgi:predicted metal-dependent hydrolase
LKEKLYFETYEILEKYSKSLNIPFNKLSIKSLKSKWGSCSFDNNITINLKLIHLPKVFLEYVIIHEACHLKEKNH